jgi:hypothetical protein
LTYVIGPRDQLVISPLFTYERTDVSNVPTSSYSYGASVGLDHAFTSRITAGVYYSAEERSFSGQLANALYNTFGVSFNYHFAPSWSFSGTLGATEVGLTGVGHEWTTTGAASLSKSFRRSSAAISVYRGNRSDPFLTNRFATRFDATYNFAITRRLSASASASYEYGTFSSTSSVPETIYGTYVTARANYRLRDRLDLVVAYGQRWQHGSNHEIIPGGHNIYTAGIIWTAVRRPELY